MLGPSGLRALAPSTPAHPSGSAPSRAATSSSASTYTAACRAAAPTFAGSAEPSSSGNDLISTTVQLPSGCTTTASGSRNAGEPATSRASIGWSSSVHAPGWAVASRSSSAVRAVRPWGPVAVRSGTRASAGGSAARSSFSCTSRSSSAPPSALTRASNALPRVSANCDCPKADGEPSALASAALFTPAPSRIARRAQPGLAASAANARASRAFAGTSGPRSSASRCRSAVPRVLGGGTRLGSRSEPRLALPWNSLTRGSLTSGTDNRGTRGGGGRRDRSDRRHEPCLDPVRRAHHDRREQQSGAMTAAPASASRK